MKEMPRLQRVKLFREGLGRHTVVRSFVTSLAYGQAEIVYVDMGCWKGKRCASTVFVEREETFYCTIVAG